MIDKKIILIAPHLTLPAQKGADILIFNRANSLIESFIDVHILATNHHYIYKNGQLIKEYIFNNKPRSKKVAAFRSLIFQNSYLCEKFLTRAYSNRLKRILKTIHFDIAYFSFIYSAYYFKNHFNKNNIVKIIETHNNDITWYKNLSNFSNDPFSKVLAKISLKKTIKMIRSIKDRFYFIVLTPKDAYEYKNFIPEKNIILIPPGIESINHSSIRFPQFNDKINLIFVGSLDVLMNERALEFFSNHFYPQLKEHFNDMINVQIVGRNPSKKIISLCKNNKWRLYENVSQETLDKLISLAHFSILPFPYTTGFKMKQLESLSLGVPFLSTSALSNQIKIDKSIPYGIYSDDPNAWIQFIENNRNKTIDPNFRNDIMAFAQKFDWNIINKKLIDFINK